MPFCPQCGAETHPAAAVCVKCGVALPGQSVVATPDAGEPKSWTVTLLLCFFLGALGVHRFYLGHTVIGIIQLFTLGGCGIWALIDFIIILVGGMKDASGRPLKK
ncbi:TM2 domain-containing protein [Mesoterricola sediminis]|uniref:TM2 domain-containing protein n=1 Tax=Mesoterricola sediminis TaxID=2927980 RepID=A0AA48GPK1_9BACT|nr:TM2 domain-containing protein [Mesoterricola sediminis]BDU76901.1 hypothetical protein METESE_18590 [Mesoterricola sediminis]